jgi:hypothetical protein
MSATSISFGLLIALFTILLLYGMRKLKLQIRRSRITKDVPLLRIDHISIQGMLLGVWPVSRSGERDAIVDK